MILIVMMNKMIRDYFWKVIRVVLIGLFAWGGFNKETKGFWRNVDITDIKNILFVVVIPIVFFAIIVLISSYYDMNKKGLKGQVDAPTWTSNFIRNESSLHFFHLAGYCLLSFGLMSLISELSISADRILPVSIGIGILSGIALAKKKQYVKNT